MQRLEISCAVRHIYIYIFIYLCLYVVRRQRVKDCDRVCKIHTYTEQDRQCTYNVTLKRVRATTVAV
jgi:hypothetical protein